MLQFDISEIEAIIGSSKSDREGCACKFFKLSDKVGLKLYSDTMTRDICYQNQQKASVVGLGPDVHGKVDNIEYFGEKFYGYLTEIVEVRSPKTYGVTDSKSVIEYMDFHDKHICTLQDDLKQYAGYDFYDAHTGNTGIKNGRLICVDFDD